MHQQLKQLNLKLVIQPQIHFYLHLLIKIAKSKKPINL